MVGRRALADMHELVEELLREGHEFWWIHGVTGVGETYLRAVHRSICEEDQRVVAEPALDDRYSVRGCAVRHMWLGQL
jgi:hypothetical protein